MEKIREQDNLPVPRSGYAIKKKITFKDGIIVFYRASSTYFIGQPLPYQLVWQRNGTLKEFLSINLKNLK